MPGSASGSKVLGADTPPLGTDADSTDELAFTNSSYDNGATVVGTTFIAPTSGAVLVLWSARMDANTAGGTNHRVLVSVKVSSGSVIGSGTVVSPAADDSALESVEWTAATVAVGTTRMQAAMYRPVTGLTPGQTYNVVVQKKCAVSGMAANVYNRTVDVLPILST